MADKVMSPAKSPRQRPGVVQAKSGIINGPTASTQNLQPFNRSGDSKKK